MRGSDGEMRVLCTQGPTIPLVNRQGFDQLGHSVFCRNRPNRPTASTLALIAPVVLDHRSCFHRRRTRPAWAQPKRAGKERLCLPSFQPHLAPVGAQGRVGRQRLIGPHRRPQPRFSFNRQPPCNGCHPPGQPGRRWSNSLDHRFQRVWPWAATCKGR